MSKIWPWSSGAPVVEEHTEFEEKMGPDTAHEYDVYDLGRPNRMEQAQAAQRQNSQQNDQPAGAPQQS
jgi:hypothetical protein